MSMDLVVSVENTSPIRRKLTIKIPARTVANRFERSLAEVQRTANLKGFRPGQAPISVVRQMYGADVRHRLYHNLIDESFQEAVREQKLMTIGRPEIEAGEHKHGEGEHDHAAHEDKDFTYTATVEVMPEIDVKGYTGIALTREKVEIKDTDVEALIKNVQDSHAELIPVGGGLVGADGRASSRPVQKGDYVEMNFDGGVVTETGVEPQEGMKGNRMIEVGSDSLIPGFEDNLVGMRSGETKTFRVPFPKDFHEDTLAGKESEFTVTINEVKEKKLPALDDDFAKQIGHETMDEFRTKAREHLTKDRTASVERKLRSDLIEALIQKNPFDVPLTLVETQTRALAQDWAEELKRNGLDDQTIQGAIMQELPNLKKRSESQVRASLILEAISKKQNITITDAQVEAEMEKISAQMKVEMPRLKEFYEKNPGRREDLEFRMRQDATVEYLMTQSKIKG